VAEHLPTKKAGKFRWLKACQQKFEPVRNSGKSANKKSRQVSVVEGLPTKKAGNFQL